MATFGALTGNPNPGTAAIITRSTLVLAIEGEVAKLNNHLIPLPSRRRHESLAWQNSRLQFADSSSSRLNWPAGSFPFQSSRSSTRRTETLINYYISFHLFSHSPVPIALVDSVKSSEISRVSFRRHYSPFQSADPLSQVVQPSSPSSGFPFATSKFQHLSLSGFTARQLTHHPKSLSLSGSSARVS